MKLNKILIFLLLASPFYAKETSFHPYIKGGTFFIICPSVGAGALYKIGDHGVDLSGNFTLMPIAVETSGKLLYQHSFLPSKQFYCGAGMGFSRLDPAGFDAGRVDYYVSFEQKFGYEWLNKKNFRYFVQLELSEREALVNWAPIPTVTVGIGF